MKTLLTLGCLSLLSMAMLSNAVAAQPKPKRPTVQRIVVPTEGVTDFSVTGRSTLFRLPVSTIGGGTIGEPKITGNVQHLGTAEVIHVGEGGRTFDWSFLQGVPLPSDGPWGSHNRDHEDPPDGTNAGSREIQGYHQVVSDGKRGWSGLFSVSRSAERPNKGMNESGG